MKPNFKQAVNSIASMCVDVLTEKLTEDTSIYNLKTFITYLEQNKEKPMSTQTHSYITKG